MLRQAVQRAASAEQIDGNLASAERLTGLDWPDDRGGDEEEVRFDWRRGGAAAAGLIAALILVVMIFLVKFANDARERRSTAERHAYEVALVVRNVSANVSSAEAALARFVLDEDVTDQRQYLRQRLATRRLSRSTSSAT